MKKSRPAPTRKELRQFGLLVGSVIALAFGALIPWLKHRSIPVWPWATGIPLVALGLFYPRVLAWPWRLWMLLGGVLGAINSRIILGVVFWLVFWPISTILRILGKDPLSRSFDRETPSYRVTRAAGAEEVMIKQMERPF